MPTDTSPTARALRAIEILQARPGMTADELGERLGVTERAARRYVGILREAGIPVESERGPHGGYRLGRGMRLPPVVFTQAEAFGLVMAVLDSPPTATDVDGLVESALAKVIQALPERVGRQAAVLHEHASAAPDRYSARPDPATTGALVAAIAAGRGVLVGYRSESGREWESEVDPWAVVVRYGRWYLLCRSHRADAIRTYRVDRIRSVEQTAHAFTAPEGLDPVAELEENLGSGWEFPTRVVFDAPMAEVARWIRPPMGRLTPLAEGDGGNGGDDDTDGGESGGENVASGGCVLVGSTSNPTMYAQEWLAGMPFAFRVEGGPELRAAVATLAERFAGALSAESA